MNIRAVPGFASLAPTAVADPTVIAQSEFLGSIVAAANQTLGQPAGVTLLPISTGGGVFNYDYVYPVVNNNQIVFNSYQDFNSLLGPVGANGALNMTAGFSSAYASLIHKLTYRRTNHENFHVRGYKEKGNINTPLELAILNQVDRFNLAIDVIDRVPKLQVKAAHVKEWLKGQIIQAVNYAHENGIDQKEIREWKWPAQ